ncbi:hypothetical protein ACPOL_1532 [Acidisarcina polymorpha]|uniref:AsmA domain-containing protein n=1 Tax=Acidisarcina polymorpha TaxID=2211140 RepID=A0A2Z5FVI4_9BACT|nr:AsmA family protein [Acidisarcina polymorpha]AXC10878.1 hypothetical protein ACPOL_1532 [Acidisarcina polymorpha]
MAAVTATGTRRRVHRWILPLVALALTSVVVLPPLISLRSFHRRIADSISQGIGRPVRMASIKMHLLPRPGFELADFVVEEDPGFGAEPILRCAQVNAYLRLSPLWRGRLEIARIGFEEPSVNLVRNHQGRWNVDSLLSQAAQAPKLPTGERHAGNLPRFPYIDASNARVNFKFGNEKMPFSFFNADLAVWLENPGEWKIQFAAQPVRTDLSLDLANTGMLRISGSLHHASTLSQMPAQLHAEWSNAALGQLSRILSGTDANWRGELDVDADILGTLNQADLKLVARGQGIHRVEFQPRDPLNMELTCQARFTRTEQMQGVSGNHEIDRSLRAITCLAPTGDGHLLLTGSVHGLPANLDPALSLEMNNVPVETAFDGVRLVRSGFAPAVQATGAINGNFTYASSASSIRPLLQGQATVNTLTIAAPAFEKPLTLPTIHFTMNAPSAPHLSRRGKLPLGVQSLPTVQDSVLQLEPFAMGVSPAIRIPLSVSGTFTRSNFSVHLSGESHVAPMVALGRELRLLRSRSIEFEPQGTADMDITIQGPWLMPVPDSEHPIPPVSLAGSLRLHNAGLTGDYLAQPLQIPSAQALLENGTISWTASSLTYGPVHGDGSLSYPIFCMTLECGRQFSLHIGSLDAATAQNALLGAGRRRELVQELLERVDVGQHIWPTLTGNVQIAEFSIGSFTVRDLNAAVSIRDHAVEVKSLIGRALDGSLHLTGALRVSGGTPHYEVEAQLDHSSSAATAAMFKEKWGPGMINLKTRLRFSGYEREQLISSASGTFHWDWLKGGLPVDLSPGDEDGAQSALAKFDTWTADGTIAKSVLTLERSRVLRGAEVVPLTGTITFNREMNLADPSPSNSLKITGTLQKPEVLIQPERAIAAQPLEGR